MINNGGCDPFHYIKGNGGLGYKPNAHYMHGLGYDYYNNIDGSGFSRMIGGMARKDIMTGKLTDEQLEAYNEKVPEDQRITEFDKFIDEVDKDKTVSNKDKFKYFNNQLGDLERLKIDDPLREDEYQDVINKIEEKLEKSKYKNFVKKEYPLLIGRHGEENYLFNQHHKEAEDKTSDPLKVHFMRGNISEKDIIDFDEETGILRNLDKDKSETYDSKDLDAYNDDFIKAIVAPYGITWSGHKYVNKNKLMDNDKKHLIEYFLSNFPIDGIKGNTIWELKSYSDLLGTNEQKQRLNETKIKGTVEFPIRYMKDKNGEIKLKNIYYRNNNTGKLVEAFKDKKNGYNYLWMFSNKDKIGYVNPLSNKNFHVERLVPGKEIYQGIWNKDEKIERKNKGKIVGYDVLIDNEDIHKFPSRYSYEFNKKMMKEKKKK